MPGSDWYSQILDRPVIFTNLALKCSFLKQSLALDENTWKVNLVITKCCNAHFACWLRHLLRSVAAIKIHLIMQELLIMREPQSGRSWTSKVFNTVITLDTYRRPLAAPASVASVGAALCLKTHFFFQVNSWVAILRQHKILSGMYIFWSGLGTKNFPH